MTDLVVRKLPWTFDERTPFQWNPANPVFGMAMNGVSFLAPAFERFIVAATRAAMPRITDPEVRTEADAFLRQEAVHARAHRTHTSALVRRYPGLQQVLDELDERFDRLLTTRSLRYQLAYVADIEATFTPMFSLMLRNHEVLFDNGDHRVAPVFLWHLSEEIEHRSSALIVYDEVVRDPWYRLRVAPHVFTHVLRCFNAFCRGVDASVPREDRGMDASSMIVGWPTLRALLRRTDGPGQFTGVPRGEVSAMLAGLVRSQVPGHRPADEETPAFAHEVLAAHDQGRDIVDWYGAAAAV
jgi:predicted metal-dependent hydrolase